MKNTTSDLHTLTCQKHVLLHTFCSPLCHEYVLEAKGRRLFLIEKTHFCRTKNILDFIRLYIYDVFIYAKLGVL